MLRVDVGDLSGVMMGDVGDLSGSGTSGAWSLPVTAN